LAMEQPAAGESQEQPERQVAGQHGDLEVPLQGLRCQARLSDGLGRTQQMGNEQQPEGGDLEAGMASERQERERRGSGTGSAQPPGLTQGEIRRGRAG